LSVDEDYRRSHEVASYPARDVPAPQLASAEFNLGLILDFARRRLWIILFFVLLMGAAGFSYFMVVPSPYTAEAILKLDTRKFQLFQQPGTLGDQTIDAGAAVESHLEGLKSENLALKIITQFDLADDPEFGRAERIPIISNLLHKRESESEIWRTRNALRVFEKHFTA
jgi:polysaccharide biosynthesis transport protein